MPPKRLHKIKLEDVIVILTLFLFLAEVINMYCIGFNINSLNFQHCTNSSRWRLQAKEFSFTVTYYKHFHYKNQLKNMQTIKGNYVLVSIGWISVKYWLDFTKPEKEKRYLTHLTDNVTF